MSTLEERWAETRQEPAPTGEVAPAWVQLGAARERLDRAEKLLAAMREWCLEGEEPEMSPTLLDQVNSFLEEVD